MPTNSPEYKALERFITADKRYRVFLYALTMIGFILLVGSAILLTNRAIEQSRQTVAKAADGQNNFVRTVIKESIRYNTCIYIVPIENRSPGVQQKCFELADLPGGLTRSDFSTIALPDDAILALPSVVPTQQSISQPSTNNSSSPKSAPSTPTSTANPSQPSGNTDSAPQPNIFQRLINNVKGIL
jgi:hypothetical protein